MIFTEYDELETMDIIKKDSWDNGFAEGEAKGKAEGMAKGMAEGMTEGADKVSQLYLYLMNNGRNEDMKKAMEDAEYRKKLLKTLSF